MSSRDGAVIVYLCEPGVRAADAVCGQCGRGVYFEPAARGIAQQRALQWLSEHYHVHHPEWRRLEPVVSFATTWS